MREKRTPDKETEILTAIEKVLSPFYTVEQCRGGHDVGHVKRMLRIAERIFVPGLVNLFLLKVAIWFHNLDRSRRFTGHRDVFIRRVLKKLDFSAEEIDLISDAVEKHSRLNDSSDSFLLLYLKDCDRLDMGAIGILRVGAGNNGPILPICLPEDFKEESRSTAEKNLGSLVHDIQRCLEWKEMLRTPKAKSFGSVRFTFLELFLDQVEAELKELNLLP